MFAAAHGRTFDLEQRSGPLRETQRNCHMPSSRCWTFPLLGGVGAGISGWSSWRGLCPLDCPLSFGGLCSRMPYVSHLFSEAWGLFLSKAPLGPVSRMPNTRRSRRPPLTWWRELASLREFPQRRLVLVVCPAGLLCAFIEAAPFKRDVYSGLAILLKLLQHCNHFVIVRLVERGENVSRVFPDDCQERRHLDCLSFLWEFLGKRVAVPSEAKALPFLCHVSAMDFEWRRRGNPNLPAIAADVVLLRVCCLTCCHHVTLGLSPSWWISLCYVLQPKPVVSQKCFSDWVIRVSCYIPRAGHLVTVGSYDVTFSELRHRFLTWYPIALTLLCQAASEWHLLTD